MPGYPYARLLQVRELREKAAQAAVVQCREHLVEAERQAHAAEQAWLDYKAQRPDLEAKLFETIRGKMIDQAGMDRYHADRLALITRELELESFFRDCEQKVEEAQSELQKALEAHLVAHRKVQKFEEHQSLWEEQQKREAEAAAEAEQEDRVVRPPSPSSAQ